MPPQGSEPDAGQPGDSQPGYLVPGAMVADRYRIERSLGEGGMGVVYLAEHVAMRKTVALKVLHADCSRNPEVVQRFEREAVAAASIDHEHVAAATDFGALPDGSFFLVLEYVSGHSLRTEVDRGALAPARAIGIMRGIVAGLAAAHARGIVHRDLKPENVMLTERGGNPDFVKVLDFGIAKLVEDADPTGPTSRPLTRIGTIMGTPNYMSPEQAVGQPCDARADIYALGVVFYEMLTGACLYDGDPIMVLAAHVTTPPPPLPPEVLAALGSHGQEIFDKLLAKSPDERYQSAGDLAVALELLGQHVSPLPPASVGYPLPPRAAPSPTDAALAGSEPAFVHGGKGVSTAATQLAMPEGDGSVQFLAIARLPDRSRRLVLGAALAAAVVGVVVLLVFALRGPGIEPTIDGPGSASGRVAASGTPGSDELPPVVASNEPLPAASASARSGKATPKPTGRGKKGSGGLRIPPPNQWFK